MNLSVADRMTDKANTTNADVVVDVVAVAATGLLLFADSTHLSLFTIYFPSLVQHFVFFQ